MRKLEGKTAYVTGGGRGIGREVVLKLAQDGANVVVNDLDADVAHAVADEARSCGVRALAVPGSVSDGDFGDRFVGAGVEAFGGIDIVVNNAGYTWDSMINKMSDAQFDAMLDVHLKAPFRILRAASQFIISAAREEAAAGRPVVRKVVNISSQAGTGGNAGQANYASAKAGVIGLTKTLAKEWGRFNVNVNAVAFGLISTRLTEATDEKKTITVEGKEIGVGIPVKVSEDFNARIPMRRAGTAQEAAGGIYLLCIPESDYVSGQTLIVSGGMVL